jgi:MFS superfamily sulfate permease-like transporter
LHISGVFGYYNISPVPLQWDHITHFAGIFSITTLFFQYSRQYLSNKLSPRNISIMLLVLLAGLGIGSIIETCEYSGFMMFGFGEGGFMFGAGDSYKGIQSVTENDLNVVGGGYFNTMWDLIWNFIGAIIAVAIMGMVHHWKRDESPIYSS